MNTLENLYYGNIAPHEYEVERGSEYDVTAKLVIRHEQELSATLTEQQKAVLEKNQRQSHRVNEPRRTRRVLPGFLFSCQASDRSYEQQNLTRPISPSHYKYDFVRFISVTKSGSSCFISSISLWMFPKSC